jgi:hypothetical protein
MTVETALALAQTLAPKSPGHLITAADWNDLVSVLVDYGQALQGLPARVAAAEAAVALLDGRVSALEPLAARLQALETQTAPLLQNYRLQVRTLAENHLVGQVATLEFTVTGLDGSALPDPLPWLDVFTSWGRLRAAPGFNVRNNAEENALSIQFRRDGGTVLAQVQLRSQFTRGLALSDELSFANTLQLQAGSTGRTVMQVLQTSASPQDPDTRIAFKTLHASYDANRSVRQYADSYVGQMTTGVFRPDRIGAVVALGEWENYRATVMAFAKPDADPTSPDPSRGVATVQVNFREWIAHWSDDYIRDVSPVLPGWSTLLGQNLQRADVLPFTVAELGRRATIEGALGHARNLVAFDQAAAVINPGNDSQLAQSKALLQGAAQMQIATGGIGNQAAASYAQHAQVSQQTGATARAAQATAADAATAKQSVLVLENRVKAAEQTGKEISAGLKNIGDGVNKINVAEVADLGGRLNRINLSLSDLATKIPNAR